MLQFPESWIDYELIDAGGQEKLERWGKYILRRPDPQAIWDKNLSLLTSWDNADMHYHRSNKGGGYWSSKGKVEEIWNINYKKLRFVIKPTAFKHTGIFPEQASNWEWMSNLIQKSKIISPKVLNLFAYTGGATVACTSVGAEVCHVDASRGMVGVAKENIKLSSLEDRPVRFIVDDVIKFVEREIRRGKKYEGIIMDPPVYGRGPEGQLWEIERDLVKLINSCKQLLSDDTLFFLVNAYATSFSHIALNNILKYSFSDIKIKIESGDNALKTTNNDLILPCGIFARFETI